MFAILAAVLIAAIPTYGPVPESSASAAAAAAAGARAMPGPLPTGADNATIVNSGSTNTAGYTLHVTRSGEVTLVGTGDLPQKKTVDPKLIAQFFADLKAAGSVEALGTGRCMKSVSFGTSTHIAYEGHVSPDISCPAGGGSRSLQLDADAIANAAGVARLPSSARRAL